MGPSPRAASALSSCLLSALGIPLVRGGMLDARDGADTTTVLINRAMAEKF